MRIDALPMENRELLAEHKLTPGMAVAIAIALAVAVLSLIQMAF
jgi:hypothetical protein